MLARRARRVACALMALALTTLVLTGLIVLTGLAATAQEPTAPAAPAAPPVTLTKVAGPGLAEQFPVGSLMVMRTREIERHLKWMSDGPLGRLVKDPEVKPLWDQLSGMAQGMNKMMQEQVGVDFLAMLGSVKGELAMGVTRLQISSSGPPSVGVMFALDCGAGAERFKQDMDGLLKMVPAEVFSKSEREVSGVAVTTFTPAKRSNSGNDPMSFIGAIHTAWIGSVLVLSNDKPGFDRMVQVRKGDPQIQTLGQTENWRDTMEKLGGAGDSTFFLNVLALSELLEATMGAMPQQVGPIVAALGLDQFPAIGLAVFLKPNEISSRMIVRYTGDCKSGLGSLMTFRKSDLAVPTWVPEDAMQVMILNYDFQKAFDGVVSLVKEAGEEHYEEFQEGLEEFEKEFGLSMQEDLLGAFAGPIVVVSYAMPDVNSTDADNPMANPLMSGTSNPTLIGLKIRNRKAIEQFLTFFEQMGAEVSEYMGATIFAAPDMGGEGPLAEAAITDDYLLFGVGPTALVRPTLQRMGGREAGFAGVEGVRDAVATLPKEGVGLVVANYGKQVANSLNVLKAMASLTDEMAMLAQFPIPSTAVLEKHLGWSAGVLLFEPGIGLIADSNWRFKTQ